MSATLTSNKIFQSFLGDASRTLYHGHTYGGNPLSAAAAMATLTLTESLLDSESMIARIQQLEIGLKKLAESDDELRARQLGLLGCLQFHTGGQSKAASVCKRLLERGVWLRPLGDCIPIVPPINISEKDLEHLLNSLEYGLDLTVKVL
jgi:adenosylmethionine-8-amino-7-oxononanoate aminotransferase